MTQLMSKRLIKEDNLNAKRKFFFLSLSFLLFIPASLFAEVTSDSLSRQLDTYFNALTELKNFNGNVLVNKNGKTLLKKTYNITGETDSLKINPDSKFIIASVSKVFVKFSLLKLVELKKLQLSDKLNRFIPDFPNGEKISVEMLMHNTSGLPRELNNVNDYDSLSLLKIVELAKLEKLQFEPGTQSLYSNVGFFMLHYIIEKQSPKGYAAFVEEAIFKKMNLNNTVEFNSVKQIPAFAQGFDNRDGKIVASSKKSINKFETGNYLSTLDDLYSFSKQIVSGNVISKSLAYELFGKDSSLAQAGGRPGYRSYFYMNLKTQVTFIFVSNYTDMPIQEVTADIINLLDNKPYEIPHKINRIEIPLSTEILKRYIGTYALDADINQKLVLALFGNKLYSVDSDGAKTEIYADSETTFFETANTKDGYIFKFNPQSKNYDLTLVSSGMKLTTKKIK
jgi:CubicO group peptidase (beta-lactamase class C family)